MTDLEADLRDARDEWTRWRRKAYDLENENARLRAENHRLMMAMSGAVLTLLDVDHDASCAVCRSEPDVGILDCDCRSSAERETLRELIGGLVASSVVSPPEVNHLQEALGAARRERSDAGS